MRDSGLERAIDAAGGISALARLVGVAQPSVSNWRRVPAERVLAVEAATAVSRHHLRPDLYPESDDAGAVDEVDLARGKMYLLLANLLREPAAATVLMELGALEQGGETALDMALAGVGKAARDTVAADVTRDHFLLFVGVGRAELVPYASYYRTGFLYERPLVAVREDIRIAGIARSGEGNVPEDSIAFLCEAMAGMALKRFPVGAEFERRFFVKHLAPWAETFFADLEKAEAGAFYRAVGTLGRIFIGLERDAFALEAANDTGATRHKSDLEGRDERQAS